MDRLILSGANSANEEEKKGGGDKKWTSLDARVSPLILIPIIRGYPPLVTGDISSSEKKLSYKLGFATDLAEPATRLFRASDIPGLPESVGGPESHILLGTYRPSLVVNGHNQSRKGDCETI